MYTNGFCILVMLFRQKPTSATDYVLALANLDDETKNRNDPISPAALPKVAKASKEGKIPRAISR
jgi:hypothetical protein